MFNSKVQTRSSASTVAHNATSTISVLAGATLLGGIGVGAACAGLGIMKMGQATLVVAEATADVLETTNTAFKRLSPLFPVEQEVMAEEVETANAMKVARLKRMVAKAEAEAKKVEAEAKKENTKEEKAKA